METTKLDWNFQGWGSKPSNLLWEGHGTSTCWNKKKKRMKTGIKQRQKQSKTQLACVAIQLV